MILLQRMELASTTTSSMNKNKSLDPLRTKKTFIRMKDDGPDCPDTTILYIIHYYHFLSVLTSFGCSGIL